MQHVWVGIFFIFKIYKNQPIFLETNTLTQMKKLLLLGVALAVLGCKSSAEQKDSRASKTVTITASEVQETVAFLASDDLKGRNTGTEGIEASASYVEKQLKSYGLKPYYETYRDSFKANGLDAFNVVLM